ncbi:T9SS type A sorting domain-containing protein [Flavivirga amylovorans]|uniref:T9SS type A sorting domain-containing protein n=1 Tax=Flavivirga amylovorans TaxID=870486 RepID=A0ABT8WYS0_9FLAO|nr:T9SS type A sorting domain-containing protein [Flavivirga amylovorans]MDO5986836.1 T9SS type A sorting domain-containing protein [Flavivirga amylovorans]
MRIIISIIAFVLGVFNATSQINAAVEKFALPNNLIESSGAIFFNNKLITHNDSGGENKLFELDTISGIVTRIVTISNATNVDWEDVTQDDTSIYIGDIGNNSGSRTDLKIYKINKTDFINATSVMAETIAFSYASQVDFTDNPNNTEWDSEALISFDDTNLLLFSKNWVDGITKACLIPKTQGTYALSSLTTTLNSGGLISGGTYNPLTKKLFLVGYTALLQPFVWVSENFNGSDIFSGTNVQTALSSFGFEQTEAIAFVNENRYFITSESFNVSPFSDYAKLISFSTNDVALSSEEIITEKDIVLYPNPVDAFLYIKSKHVNSIEIYDTKLVQLYKGNNISVDMNTFSQGIYIIKINLKNDTSQIRKIIKR